MENYNPDNIKITFGDVEIKGYTEGDGEIYLEEKIDKDGLAYYGPTKTKIEM